MEGPRWAHQRLHDRWSTLLLRFGFSRGIIPCLGVLRHTGGASGVLVCAAPEIAEAPTLDEDVAAEERKKLPDRESPPPSEPPPSGWQVVAARGVASPSQDLERLRPFLERLEGAHFPVRLTQLAHGLPVGGELDYLDEGTLAQALRARKPVG